MNKARDILERLSQVGFEKKYLVEGLTFGDVYQLIKDEVSRLGVKISFLKKALGRRVTDVLMRYYDKYGKGQVDKEDLVNVFLGEITPFVLTESSSSSVEKIKKVILDELDNMVKGDLEELLDWMKSLLDNFGDEKDFEEEYVFNFEATNDPRKGIPYVALLVLKGNKIGREFFDLDRSYGKKKVTVSGSFSVSDGDIFEVRWGGSWKNDYRYWYVVKGGEVYEICDIGDSKGKSLVLKYLKGEASIDDLVEYGKNTVMTKNFV